ncbi:MAG: hypothetical protein H3C58_07230 [Fimbriimonadaceae bacterium]|nr:hypothetical protein [Fimbriimonadaceae bacterium]
MAKSWLERWCLVLGALGVGLAAFPRAEPETWTIVVGGDTAGYLAPCGCAKPMVGGVMRRATVVRNAASERTVSLELGPLAGGLGRQSELKAETLAELTASLGVDAIGLSADDARLGSGVVASVARLSQDRLTTLSLGPGSALGLPRTRTKGPFLIGAASVEATQMATRLADEAVPVNAAVQELVDEAQTEHKVPILLLDGRLDDARRTAEAHPELALVVYRSPGDPPKEPVKVGATWLVSPGEKGKHVIRLEWSAGSLRGYQPIKLGADLVDDERAAALYREYQDRVRSENLLARRPRSKGEAFAGSDACGICHAAAYTVWKDSQHAGALATLDKTGHDADPDCVGCHVVGLDRDAGFKSRALTPELADVGCESCHGPGAAHVADPGKGKMAKVGAGSCAPCHVPDHSPGFDFAAYWERIKH